MPPPPLSNDVIYQTTPRSQVPLDTYCIIIIIRDEFYNQREMYNKQLPTRKFLDAERTWMLNAVILQR